MPPDLALYVNGVLLTIVGVLLVRVLRSVDDTNTKVTAQSVSFAKMEGTVAQHDVRITGLDLWRAEVQKRDLDAALARIAELEQSERRHGPSDRRENA